MSRDRLFKSTLQIDATVPRKSHTLPPTYPYTTLTPTPAQIHPHTNGSHPPHKNPHKQTELIPPHTHKLKLTGGGCVWVGGGGCGPYVAVYDAYASLWAE